jgi:hypothetical protein
VVSPADALAIQLLQLTGGDSYVFATPAPTLVVSASVEDGAGFVADSGALGVLFLGPLAFATFEENNGTTNTSTVRAEFSGLFLVQRPDAAATLSTLPRWGSRVRIPSSAPGQRVFRGFTSIAPNRSTRLKGRGRRSGPPPPPEPSNSFPGSRG